jgi:hypothetical protein
MFTRLPRESPWSAQIGCGAVLALITAAPGLFIGYMTWTRDHSDNRNAILGFSAIWIVVGAMVFLSSLMQVLATRSPQTIVEIDPVELMPGETVRIHILQPGPVFLRSIHANLSGEEDTWRRPRASGKRSLNRRYLGPYRMMEIGREAVGGGETLDREGTFTIPDVEPSLESAERKVRWKIEVWGKVSWWPGFMHPFVVKIVPRRA